MENDTGGEDLPSFSGHEERTEEVVSLSPAPPNDPPQFLESADDDADGPRNGADAEVPEENSVMEVALDSASNPGSGSQLDEDEEPSCSVDALLPAEAHEQFPVDEAESSCAGDEAETGADEPSNDVGPGEADMVPILCDLAERRVEVNSREPYSPVPFEHTDPTQAVPEFIDSVPEPDDRQGEDVVLEEVEVSVGHNGPEMMEFNFDASNDDLEASENDHAQPAQESGRRSPDAPDEDGEGEINGGGRSDDLTVSSTTATTSTVCPGLPEPADLTVTESDNLSTTETDDLPHGALDHSLNGEDESSSQPAEDEEAESANGDDGAPLLQDDERNEDNEENEAFQAEEALQVNGNEVEQPSQDGDDELMEEEASLPHEPHEDEAAQVASPALSQGSEEQPMAPDSASGDKSFVHIESEEDFLDKNAEMVEIEDPITSKDVETPPEAPSSASKAPNSQSETSATPAFDGLPQLDNLETPDADESPAVPMNESRPDNASSGPPQLIPAPDEDTPANLFESFGLRFSIRPPSSDRPGSFQALPSAKALTKKPSFGDTDKVEISLPNTVLNSISSIGGGKSPSSPRGVPSTAGTSPPQASDRSPVLSPMSPRLSTVDITNSVDASAATAAAAAITSVCTAVSSLPNIVSTIQSFVQRLGPGRATPGQSQPVVTSSNHKISPVPSSPPVPPTVSRESPALMPIASSAPNSSASLPLTLQAILSQNKPRPPFATFNNGQAGGQPASNLAMPPGHGLSHRAGPGLTTVRSIVAPIPSLPVPNSYVRSNSPAPSVSSPAIGRPILSETASSGQRGIPPGAAAVPVPFINGVDRTGAAGNARMMTSSLLSRLTSPSNLPGNCTGIRPPPAPPAPTYPVTYKTSDGGGPEMRSKNREKYRFTPPPAELKLNLPAAGYPCTECGDTFALKSSLEAHLQRRSLIIQASCMVCRRGLAFYNGCAYNKHIREHRESRHSNGSILRNVTSRSVSAEDLNEWFSDTAISRYMDLERLMVFEFGEPEAKQPAPTAAVSYANSAIANALRATEERSKTVSCAGLAAITASTTIVNSGVAKAAVTTTAEAGVATLPAMPASPGKQSPRPLGIKCPECKAPTSGPTGLRDHFAYKLPAGQKQFICSSCQAVYFSICSFNAHSRTHKSLAPFVCSECGCVLNSGAALSAHYLEHRRSPSVLDAWRCTKCYTFYSSKDALLMHIAATHCDGYFKCQACPMAFKTQASFDDHKKSEHKGKPANMKQISKCPQCDTVFQLREQLVDHLKSHPNMIMSFSVYRCPVCGRLMENKAGLLTHYRNVHKISIEPGSVVEATIKVDTTPAEASPATPGSPSKAPALARRTGSASAASAGPKTVSAALAAQAKLKEAGMRDYPCSIPGCVVRCTSDMQRKQHIQARHRDQLQCSVCKNLFFSLETLFADGLKHQREGKIICLLCNNLDMGVAEKLSDHLQSHVPSGGLRFYCRKHCRRTFETFEVIYNHMLEMHGQPTLQCRKCGDLFTHNAALIAHRGGCMKRRMSTTTTDSEADAEAATATSSVAKHSRLMAAQMAKATPSNRPSSSASANSPLTCAACHSKFPAGDRSSFLQHIRQHRTDSDYQCLECGLCYATSQSFSCHLIAVHHIAKPKEYLFENLQARPKAHEIKAFFACDVCQGEFESESALQLHMKTHGLRFLKEQTAKK